MPKFKNIKVPRMKGGKKVGTRLQRVQVLKSGKLKFVKNKPRGGGRSKSAAKKVPARKGGGRSVAKKSNPGKRPEKIGAVLKGARAVDTVSGPAQGVAIRADASIEKLKSRYDSKDALVTSASAGATGLLRNVITSKSGAYRGVSQNKILSYVQVLAPEIVATSHVNPLTNPRKFNDMRHLAHEAYDPGPHRFLPGAAAFRESAMLQGVAWIAQKAAQKLGINRMLPKGWNL